MNWTSTKVLMWQIDCETFRKVEHPFELREVTTPEHQAFVEVFAARHDLPWKKEGTTVVFRPPKPD